VFSVRNRRTRYSLVTMEAINVNSNTQHNRTRKGTLRNVHNSQQSSWACVTLTCGLIAHGISTRG